MEKEKQNLTEEKVEEVEVEVVDNLVDDIDQAEENNDHVVLSEEQQKIAELEAEVKQVNDRLLRVQADYDNFRRRTRIEAEASAKYRSQSLIEQLIPAIDNFDRALSVKVESDDAKSLLQGMEMVYRQLTEALNKEGLEVIAAVGENFDPHFHQAVMQVESDEHESNQVVEELQKGYKLKDRVIRPSMVKVNQ